MKFSDLVNIKSSNTSPMVTKIRVYSNTPTTTPSEDQSARSVIWNVFGFCKEFPKERVLLASFTSSPDTPKLMKHFLGKRIPIFRDMRTNKLKRLTSNTGNDELGTFVDPTI